MWSPLVLNDSKCQCASCACGIDHLSLLWWSIDCHSREAWGWIKDAVSPPVTYTSHCLLSSMHHHHVLWLHGGQWDDCLLPRVPWDGPSINAECIARDGMAMFLQVSISITVALHSWLALPLSLFPGKSSSLSQYQFCVLGSLQVPYHPLHGFPMCMSRVHHEPCQVGDGVGNVRSHSYDCIHQGADCLSVWYVPDLLYVWVTNWQLWLAQVVAEGDWYGKWVYIFHPEVFHYLLYIGSHQQKRLGLVWASILA